MEIVYQSSSVSYLYDICSIILGLAAIVFAVHSVQVKGCLICCTATATLTGISLLCQLLELKRLAGIGDFSAIDDTLGARCFAAGVLLAAVLILNLCALLRGKKKNCDNC